MTERTKYPHPHAALMLQYAQEAATDAEAWRNWDIGSGYSGDWVALTEAPSWRSSIAYRRRPEPKPTVVINGVELEAPLREAPPFADAFLAGRFLQSDTQGF